MPKRFLKRPIAASWIRANHIGRILLWSMILLIAGSTGWAKNSSSSGLQNGFDSTSSQHGRIITFTDGDIAFAAQPNPPSNGWKRESSPALVLADLAERREGDAMVAWARFRFSSKPLDAGQLAIFTENNRERLAIFLNGVELYRNYRSADAPTLGWNHPYIVPLPRKLLGDGMNEIILRAESDPQFNLSLGTLSVGPQAELSAHYQSQYFWRISGPQAANYSMLLLTMLVFLIWLGQRQETEYLWLAITGISWFIRDYHFFAKESFGDPLLFQQITYYSLYFAVTASFSFCVEFFKMKHRRLIIGFMFGAGIALCVARVLILQISTTDMVSNMMTLALSVGFIVMMTRYWLRSGSPEQLAMIIAVIFATLMALHDIGRIPNINWWDGMGFHIQPFTGLLLFCVFLYSMARRYLKALRTAEQMTASLETKVEDATTALMQSEKARQQMELDRALESERERLMREMHDGIGSNLVTALTIARRSENPDDTVTTLENALADLKITVDSLAPVEGDVVALLANLRHRLEPDLKRAGVRCLWQAEPVENLDWLDATNALHMLRIIQEAISNVLMHSSASEVTIGSMPKSINGMPGVSIMVADNGKGFQLDADNNKGHGLSNMQARATALEGKLKISSGQGKGTKISLWLPRNKHDHGSSPSQH